MSGYKSMRCATSWEECSKEKNIAMNTKDQYFNYKERSESQREREKRKIRKRRTKKKKSQRLIRMKEEGILRVVVPKIVAKF
jgi:hypothetical protein